MNNHKCRICGDEVEHPDDHDGLCCDHFDLSCGMPIKQLNAERAERGEGLLQPVAKQRSKP